LYAYVFLLSFIFSL